MNVTTASCSISPAHRASELSMVLSNDHPLVKRHLFTATNTLMTTWSTAKHCESLHQKRGGCKTCCGGVPLSPLLAVWSNPNAPVRVWLMHTFCRYGSHIRDFRRVSGFSVGPDSPSRWPSLVCCHCVSAAIGSQPFVALNLRLNLHCQEGEWGFLLLSSGENPLIVPRHWHGVVRVITVGRQRMYAVLWFCLQQRHVRTVLA